jgi:RND family efflux transporter MFP subunit
MNTSDETRNQGHLESWKASPAAHNPGDAGKARDAAGSHVPHAAHAAHPPPGKPAQGTEPPHPAQEGGHEDPEGIPANLKKPHALTVIAVAAVFAALLGGLFYMGYVPHKKAEHQAAKDAEEMADSGTLVAVAKPKVADGAKEIVLPCDLRPNQDTLVFPRASGYLKKLYVDIQSRVEKDQLLAEIDAPEVDAQLLQAQAALKQSKADANKAQADLELAERTLTRYRNARVTGTEVSQQELDERETARHQAEAAVAQAQANIAAAEANVQRLQVLQGFEKVTAPFAGVITARNFDVGSLLSPTGGRPLFQLQQSDTLRVYVNVPQVYATDLKTGQEAKLTVRNYPRRTFTGKVVRRAQAINSNTRTEPFELEFANPDLALVPGMYGQVQLAVTSAPKALLIPVSAMLFNAQGTQVAVVQEGKVHFQRVTVGRDLGTDLEVIDGLTPDMQVVTNPGERLAEGVEVQVDTGGAVASGGGK